MQSHFCACATNVSRLNDLLCDKVNRMRIRDVVIHVDVRE